MAPRRLRFERSMSEQEALMWALEEDPVLRSAFAVVTFFDRPVDQERFRRRLERAARLVPRLHQRVVEPPAGVGLPIWADDPFFDLDFHLRRVAIPGPGTERQVLDLAAVLSADPFDRARPLWQFVIVDGLADGRGAMVQRLHHTVTDGEGGVRLSAMFLDLERDPPPGDDDDGAMGVGAEEEEPEAGGGPFPVGIVMDTVAGGARLGAGMARRAVAGTVDTLTNPLAAPGKAVDAIETARSLLRQMAVTEPSRSPLWLDRSLTRHVEVLSVPLDDVSRAAKARGGTVNDAFVAGAVGAAGAYHRALGAPVDELRMAMPISIRTDRESGSNAFAPTRMLVPTGIVDPAERFDAVHEVLSTTRSERAVNLVGQFAGLLTALPRQMLERIGRQQVGTVDFTTSNVRGAPFDLFVGGARIEANYPMGPMAGTAFNLTTMSYRGNLDMGLVVDTRAVAEPELLRRCMVEAFDEVVALG